MTTETIGILTLAYLAGSIPFGLIIAKVFLGFDVRTKGSGNIGMTNVMRTGGKLPGLATFILDLGKGAFAVFIAKQVFQSPIEIGLAAGGLAVFGHTRSLFLKFTGGKGVATNLGIWLALDWRLFLVLAVVWISVFLISRISSLSALISLIVMPGAAFYLYSNTPVFWTAIAISLYLIVLHHENIGRLIRAEEGKLK